MSSDSIPYKLRPNKAVDRELFISFLARIGAQIQIEDCEYIGLGGPFLEDFRVLHARLGLEKMICIENVENTHKRQLFNKPLSSINCVHEELETFLEDHTYEHSSVIWLDYTDPSSLKNQIESFSKLIGEVELNSVLRITLNANPSTLKCPTDKEIQELRDDSSRNKDLSNRQDLMKQWRLEKYQEKISPYLPTGATHNSVSHKSYGKLILQSLHLAVEKALTSEYDRKLIWSFSTLYSDGQPMVTATAVVVDAEDEEVFNTIEHWDFKSSLKDPLVLDMPALSTIERITLESKLDGEEHFDYDLPTAQLGQKPINVFKKFYRVYPQFARVDT